MLIFLDTEFTDFVQIDLISVGLVTEDGREFYGERTDYLRAHCNDFVQETVLPLLGRIPDPQYDTEALATQLREWLASLGSFELACDSFRDRDLLINLLGEMPPQFVGWLNLCEHTSASYIQAEAEFHTTDKPWHHALHDAQAMCAGWLASTIGKA